MLLSIGLVGDAAFSTPCSVHLQSALHYDTPWSAIHKLRPVSSRIIMIASDSKTLQGTNGDNANHWRAVCSSPTKYIDIDSVEFAISEHSS